ncbi:MAG TPA: hypothetical protein VF155_09200 [Candidatus Dormibacteraeota bacterium]
MSPAGTEGAEPAACQLCPARLAQSASQLLGQSLSELVPPEAQRHLLNAQRELLLAAMVTIEHNTSRGRAAPAPRARKRGTAAKRAPRTRRPSRVELD